MNVICWWSGGITSSVACKVAIDLFGLDSCRMIMIDTRNEDDDTYRFKEDCEQWYGKEIEVIASDVYPTIQDVWHRFNSLNVATGAICSTNLKRLVRERWQKTNDYDYQVFGFEFEKKEFNRALSMKLNHPKSKAIFPLIMMGYDKIACMEIVTNAGIDIPMMYQLGFNNNNCFKTGCVQGGIGYWKKMKVDFPDKFERMADLEHELTEKRGSPVTMLKDQSKQAKDSGNTLVFLRKNPSYPELKCIDDMPECKVEPLMECNGFCGVNDLNPKNATSYQLNFDYEQ
jgi:3'-phosphoadenosine 5'-phosphosulfate sulfotransferase (PAPS reductase)/FAD synthetase